MWERFKRADICVRQHDSYDCGAAALCSVAAWHGLYIPLTGARAMCGCTKEGITIKGILDAANAVGLEAKAFKSPEKEFESLAALNAPYILHTRDEDGLMHFVTVVGISTNGAHVMDPAYGEISFWHIGKLCGKWSGYVIALSPGKNFKKGGDKETVFSKLYKIAMPYKSSILFCMAITFAIMTASAANSFILQYLIDVTAAVGKRSEMFFIACAVLGIWITVLILNHIKGLKLLSIGLQIDKHLINNYIKKIFTLPANIFNQFANGDLNSRIGDAYKIRMFISEGLLALPTSCATLLIILILMFRSNSGLAVLSLSFIPLYAVLCLMSVRLNKRHNRELAHLGARFQESMLHGMDSVITTSHFGAGNYVSERILSQFEALQREIRSAGVCSTRIATSGAGLYTLLISSTLVVGGYMIIGKTITTGELVSFYTLCSIFAAPLDALVEMHTLYSQASVSVERLLEISDYESECKTTDEKLDFESIKTDDIIIENLTFRYPGRENIIERLSTVIKSGRITAVCGSNGCGKSTLASLLMRDMQPYSGRIMIGKYDLSSIPAALWRNEICIVPQKIFIYNDTLLKNIACMEEEPDIERAALVCIEAGLSELVQKMPAGLHTHLGEGGGLLSGGELQKIAIARALYKDPHTFIFDESTSNMDDLSEMSVAALVQRLKKRGKRIILISHSSKMKSIADDLIDLG